MENLIYILLLIIHNIALVGCAAAPFYNLRLVNQRAQFGKKLYYQLDKVVEDTIQGLEPYCWTFIILLFITGFGFSATYYAFHGQLKEFNPTVFSAFILKHIFVLGMVGIAFYISFFINPKIREIFSKFSPDAAPQEEIANKFFSLRAKRKQLCKICFVFAMLILIVSPVLRFY
ncbi:MAG: hypothetical protein Q8N09_06830 [Thermodesulfovibrionia bacterium]|nr:hypothetical protein [Thermodesulfovibrionia bacterium]